MSAALYEMDEMGALIVAKNVEGTAILLSLLFEYV